MLDSGMGQRCHIMQVYTVHKTHVLASDKEKLFEKVAKLKKEIRKVSHN